MINSLFETFDPIIRTLNLNFSIFLIPLLFPNNVKINFINTRLSKILQITQHFIFEEIKASINNPNNKINLLILIRIFIFILFFNIFGLFPFIYTLTRQIIFTFSLALPFWLAITLFRISQNTNHFLSHLVPLSTPIALSQFITIIETIRQLIRPITLSVRLCANITAGHILIALTRKPIFILNIFSSLLSILIILEIAVAFIQRYVFTILLSIYLRETI